MLLTQSTETLKNFLVTMLDFVRTLESIQFNEEKSEPMSPLASTVREIVREK